MDVVSQFAGHIASTQYSDLPRAVVENTKKFILDTIGVGIAGLEAPGCLESLDVVRAWGGVPESTVLMNQYKCSSPWAAFLNSIFMHALDFDDALDESPLHANVSVLPAALALGESRKGTTGKDLICSVTLGQDVACRIGASLKRPLAWTRTTTCGFFAASAAAGKILGLNMEQMWNTFGISYCQTAGNIQCMLDGVLVKRMQPAFAAKSAVMSACLAAKGITGTKNVLEGDYGFFKLYEGNEYDENTLLAGLGEDFRGMQLSVKPYPCCRMTHASIDAALKLRKEFNIEIADIEKIVVKPSQMVCHMVGMPFQIRKDPQVDAQFSIPYTVAVALHKGDVFLEDFEEKTVLSKPISDLPKRVHVVPDPDIEERDIMKCSIEVLTKDGRTLTSQVSAIKGNPMNPMSIEECMEKFRKCVAYGPRNMPESQISRILDILGNLEQIDDVAILMDLLSQ